MVGVGIDMLTWIKKIFFIMVAIALMSVSVNMFLGPHHIAAGGLTGLSIILERLWGVDRAVIILVGNVVILICALVFLDKEIFLKTAIGALLLPIFIALTPHLMLVSNAPLSMVVGSVLFGVAVAILYHYNASSGGTAVPPLIFKKYFNLSPSIGLFVTDGVVVILSLLVFNVEAFLYAVFSIFITSVVMHYIEDGLDRKKLVYIISTANDTIAAAIINELGKDVTIMPVDKISMQNDTTMLMITINSQRYQQLISIVKEQDQKAFMLAAAVSDVNGRGFSYEPGSV